MSTDALALTQLELLYRLGVIERESPTSFASTSSNSRRPQQQQQPRAASASVRSSCNGSDDEELRMATAVRSHPPCIKQLDGDADYDNYGADNTRTPFYSISRARAYRSIRASPPRRRERSLVPTAPRQSSQQPVKTTTPAERPRWKPREQARVWFLYWKLFVCTAREKSNVHTIWLFNVKKRVMQQWKCLLQYQKRVIRQITMLQQWKATRTVHRWSVWTTNHQRIQLLLENIRFSLVNRLRRHRAWLRWLRFSSQSRKWKAILNKQSQIREARHLRTSWLEFKVFMCRNRQTRRGLHKFLQALQRYREMAEIKQRSLQRNRMVIQSNTLRRLLCRWRELTELRISTRRLQGQVAFGISRRRYFRIWRECRNDNRCIAEFRAKQDFSAISRHLFAWRLAAKALRMARRRAVWTHRDTRARSFHAWKQKAAFARHSKSAAQDFERFKIAKALTRFRTWVAGKRRQCQIEDRWQLRLLKKVWRLGFLELHKRQQTARAEQKKLELQVQGAHFAQWLEFRRTRIQDRNIWRNAVALSLRSQVCRRFARWKLRWRQRKLDKKHLARGDQFYRSRLMQKGVDELSALVAQRNENTATSHLIRRQTRLFMKTRTLRVWKQLTQRNRKSKKQIDQFHARERYQRSWFNPRRRVWSAWRAFIASKAQMKRADAAFQGTLKRKCLVGWRCRAQYTQAAFLFQHLQSVKALETSLAKWQSRTSHWQKMREVSALARAVYHRKRYGKILREWAKWARKSSKVRRRCQRLEQLSGVRLLASSFQAWNRQFQWQTTASQFAVQRKTIVRTRCLREWHQYVSKHVRLKRKLTYFQQVFGKHSTTSLVQRIWKRWTRYTSTSLDIKSLWRRQHCKQMRRSWAQWTFFHLYIQLFREWHRVAAQNALDNQSFGKRLRQFHASRRDLLKSRLLRMWKTVYKRKQSEREVLKTAKHRVLRAIVFRSQRHTQAQAKYLRKWFSRWHNGIYVHCNAATRFYEAKLARRMLVVWWRVMVNAKQELVLSEAKQVLGSLSFYHPQQKLYTQFVKEKALSMRAMSANSKRELKSRDVKMKKMRRMLDPEEKSTYSSNRQYGAGRFHSEAVGGEQHQTMVMESRHVNFQARVHPSVVKSTSSISLHDDEKEPRRLRLAKQNSSCFVPKCQDDRVDEEAQHSRQHQMITRVIMTSEPSFEKRHRSPRRNTNNSLWHHGGSPDSQSSGSVDHYEQTRPTVIINQPEELPLVDPLTPLRPPIHNTREVNKPHTRKETSYHLQPHDDRVPPHAQSVTLKPSNELIRTSNDDRELPLYDEGETIHRNGRSSAWFSAFERYPLQVEKTMTHAFRHPDQPLLSSRDTAQEDELPPPAPPVIPFHSHQRSQVDISVTTQAISFDGDISLEQLASLEVFEASTTSRETPQMMASVHSQPLQLSASALGLSPESRHRRSKVSVARKLPAPSTSSEELSLSAILELPEKASQLKHAKAREAEIPQATLSSPRDTVSSNSSGDILNEILAHYAQPLVEVAAEEKQKKANFKTRRKQTCFRMLRDLGLFQNQFYYPQMERVMEIISTEHIALIHERLKSPIDEDDTEYLSQLEREYLKQFLVKCIEKHPLFITQYGHSEAALNLNRRSHVPAFSSAEWQAELQWLAQVHLQPRVCAKATTRQHRDGKPFWIQHPLPSDVESALPKLLLCVSKYFKVLTQLFFARTKTTRTTGPSEKQPSNAQQLTKTEFTQLLKHVHVFPQLLTRREAESAFDGSCCSSPDQKEVCFPEFVEALIRCSASLQWGNTTISKSGDNGNCSETGVVVKFLMLLFAMEGRGSVLQKRNEDLQVVLGYLEQQQTQKNAGRMVRFRKLLVDQKHQGTRRGTTRHHHDRDRSSWMPSELSSKRSGARSVSPLRGFDDGNLFYCGEPGSQGYDHLENEILQSNGGDAYEPSYQNELASPVDTEEWRDGFLQSSKREHGLGCEPTIAEQQRLQAQQSTSGDVDDIGEYALPAEAFERSSLRIGSELAKQATMITPLGDVGIPDATSVPETAYDTARVEEPPADLYHVGELRDKSAFLDEILTSIGDVELVLQQSNFQLHRQQSQVTAAWTPNSVDMSSSTVQRKAKSVDEYSDDFESESAENVAANVMRALFTDTSSTSLLLLHQMESDEQMLLGQVEDVRVNDPLLNQLTDIERFTDSSGSFAYVVRLSSCVAVSLTHADWWYTD